MICASTIVDISHRLIYRIHNIHRRSITAHSPHVYGWIYFMCAWMGCVGGICIYKQIVGNIQRACADESVWMWCAFDGSYLVFYLLFRSDFLLLWLLFYERLLHGDLFDSKHGRRE